MKKNVFSLSAPITILGQTFDSIFVTDYYSSTRGNSRVNYKLFKMPSEKGNYNIQQLDGLSGTLTANGVFSFPVDVANFSLSAIESGLTAAEIKQAEKKAK